jgi:hypothetical protein
VIPVSRVAIAPCLPGLRQSGRSAGAWRYAQPDINNEEMTMRKTVYQSNYDRLITLGIVKDGQLHLALAEAYSFQQAIPPIYQDVYPEPGKVRPKLKKELNSFLRLWLQNLIDQDHGETWIDNEANAAAPRDGQRH